MSPPSELEVAASRRVGTVLRGKYRIDRVLGVGGMAVVYKATHRNQAEFAVKMLHPELSIREDVCSRFLREGYAANSVKHPGAVVVVDDDVAEDGAAFLVMELLDGEGVEALWERSNGRVPVRGAVAIGHQLLDVLASAHARGIVHRDIKPANVFATRDGTLKVLDFGIARARDAAAGASNATGTGILLGTPAFMAPEQAMGQAKLIDGQTDVWAAGATLFALLGGTYVHEGENAAQLLIFAATRPARSLAAVAPDVPPGIVEVVDRALAFEKAARWPTATAMRDALEEASRAAFGEGPSKVALASLLKTSEAALAPTAYFEAPRLSAVTRGASAPGAPSGDASVRAAPPATAPRVGFSTTAKPVASTSPPQLVSERVPGLEKTNPKPLLAAAAVLLVLGGAGLVARLATHGGDAPSLAQAPTTMIENASAPAEAPALSAPQAAVASVASEGARAPALVAQAAQASGASNPGSATVPEGGAAGGPRAHRAAETGGSPHTNGHSLGEPASGAGIGGGPPAPGAVGVAAPASPAAAAAPSVPPSTAAAAPAPPAKPKPNCNPNYTFDVNGNKHFKPECF